MMTLGAALSLLKRKFVDAGIETARREAEWIIREVCEVPASRILAFPEEPISDAEWEACTALAVRRASGVPIQYVLGFAEFLGMRVRVTPETLIPRPETEQLVELLLDKTASILRPRVLDVGTGCGCIALAFQSARNSARTWACDVDAGALRVAYHNRSSQGLPVSFFQSDALRPGFARAFSGILDAIVSNPPYIARTEFASLPPLVRDHEPHLALFTPDDPLAFYRSIAREARAVLRPAGQLLFEVHEDRGQDVASLLESAGYVSVVVEQDLAGKDRFVRAVFAPTRSL